MVNSLLAAEGKTSQDLSYHESAVGLAGAYQAKPQARNAAERL